MKLSPALYLSSLALFWFFSAVIWLSAITISVGIHCWDLVSRERVVLHITSDVLMLRFVLFSFVIKWEFFHRLLLHCFYFYDISALIQIQLINLVPLCATPRLSFPISFLLSPVRSGPYDFCCVFSIFFCSVLACLHPLFIFSVVFIWRIRLQRMHLYSGCVRFEGVEHAETTRPSDGVLCALPRLLYIFLCILVSLTYRSMTLAFLSISFSLPLPDANASPNSPGLWWLTPDSVCGGIEWRQDLSLCLWTVHRARFRCVFLCGTFLYLRWVGASLVACPHPVRHEIVLYVVMFVAHRMCEIFDISLFTFLFFFSLTIPPIFILTARSRVRRFEMNWRRFFCFIYFCIVAVIFRIQYGQSVLMQGFFHDLPRVVLICLPARASSSSVFFTLHVCCRFIVLCFFWERQPIRRRFSHLAIFPSRCYILWFSQKNEWWWWCPGREYLSSDVSRPRYFRRCFSLRLHYYFDDFARDRRLFHSDKVIHRQVCNWCFRSAIFLIFVSFCFFVFAFV